MTDVTPHSHTGHLQTRTPGQLCFGFFALFCLFLILRNADIAIEYMTAGLRLCAVTVVPSLFPFLVLSELIVSGGIGRLLLRPLSGPLSGLFRLPPDGCCAILLGMFCGFPVGARAAVSAYDRGTLTRDEAERVICASTNPSSAFLLNAVGVSLHGSRRFGSVLLTVTLLSALLIGILLARLPSRKERDATVPSAEPIVRPPKSGAQFFTDAIRSALTGMLTVCAYVVFFSAFCGTLTVLVNRLRLPGAVRAAVFCVFELSGGVSVASALKPPLLSAVMTAFAVGWSGLSVHCQVLSVCDGRGFRMRRYFLCKLLHGILTAAGFLLALRLSPSLLIPPAQSTEAFAPAFAAPVVTVLFLACLPLLFFRKRQSDKTAD